MVSDRPHHVASCFIEAGPHDRPAGGDGNCNQSHTGGVCATIVKHGVKQVDMMDFHQVLATDGCPEGADRVKQAGFTLLEVLVVIAILGLLIGLVAPAVLRQLGGAKVSIAKQSIQSLGAVLDLYRLDAGSYPTTEQGLQALVTRPTVGAGWNGPYVKGDKLPIDAWDHPYVYRNPSARAGYEYDLCSLGPNAQGGATDQTGSICN